MRSSPEQLQFELSLPQFYSLLRSLEQVSTPHARAADARLCALHTARRLTVARRSQAQQQLGISPAGGAGDSARG